MVSKWWSARRNYLAQRSVLTSTWSEHRWLQRRNPPLAPAGWWLCRRAGWCD